MNLIIVDNFNLHQMDRTLWYTINYDELEKLVEEYYKAKGESLPNPKDNSDDFIGSKENSHDTQNEPSNTRDFYKDFFRDFYSIYQSI